MQWNQFTTDTYSGSLSEVINYQGNNGDLVNAYISRPLGPGPYGAVVVVHHAPGWDEFYRETTRRFTEHGYIAICPNLYYRFGKGTPDDVTAAARGQGGLKDPDVVGDLTAAMKYVRALPYHNGKVGIIGTCSGGRHGYLTACSTDGFDAVADLWGGRLIMGEGDLNANTPVSPITLTPNLKAPLLGIFGNEDQNPAPAAVDQHEAELKRLGKNYEFHRYDGAGHGFFYYDRPAYRQQQAMDGWSKVFGFFDKNLQGQ